MPKELTGKVISLKMPRTAVVEMESRHSHPLYQKMLKKNKHFKAHHELELKVGDKVKIRETRPISRDKKWKVVSKL